MTVNGKSFALNLASMHEIREVICKKGTQKNPAFLHKNDSNNVCSVKKDTKPRSNTLLCLVSFFTEQMLPGGTYEKVNLTSKWLSFPVLETHCESDDHQLSDDPAGSKSD